MRTRARLGLSIGFLTAIAAFAAIQIDRILVEPMDIKASAQAEAQSARLNVYGAIMIAAAILAVISGIVVVVQRWRS